MVLENTRLTEITLSSENSTRDRARTARTRSRGRQCSFSNFARLDHSRTVKPLFSTIVAINLQNTRLLRSGHGSSLSQADIKQTTNGLASRMERRRRNETWEEDSAERGAGNKEKRDENARELQAKRGASKLWDIEPPNCLPCEFLLLFVAVYRP